MPTRVQVASRDNQKVLLFWKPAPKSEVRSYNIYTALERGGPYTQRVINVLNRAGDTGTAPKTITSFYRQGAITFELPAKSYGINSDVEFYVKVTEVSPAGTEELIAVAPHRYVRLPGRAATIQRNVNFDKEKGIVGWDEENNTHKRVSATLQEDVPDERYSLDVKVLESLIKITNDLDTDTNPIPLLITRTSDPVNLSKVQAVDESVETDIFDSLDFTPDSEKKYGIVDIRVSTSQDIKYSLEYNNVVLDQGHLIAMENTHFNYSGDYVFEGAEAGGDLKLKVTADGGGADVFALVILDRRNK